MVSMWRDHILNTVRDRAFLVIYEPRAVSASVSMSPPLRRDRSAATPRSNRSASGARIGSRRARGAHAFTFATAGADQCRQLGRPVVAAHVVSTSGISTSRAISIAGQPDYCGSRPGEPRTLVLATTGRRRAADETGALMADRRNRSGRTPRIRRRRIASARR